LSSIGATPIVLLHKIKISNQIRANDFNGSNAIESKNEMQKGSQAVQGWGRGENREAGAQDGRASTGKQRAQDTGAGGAPQTSEHPKLREGPAYLMRRTKKSRSTCSE
jgi:hypothetical protein